MADLFDFDKFRKDRFVDRTGTIILKNFGDTTEEKEIRYKQLSPIDMCDLENTINELNQDKIKLLAEVLIEATNIKADDKDKLLESIGIKEKTPETFLRKVFVFERGVMNLPDKWSRPDTINFAKAHYLEFNQIFTAIWNATCMGQVKKNPKSSGKMEKSETTVQSGIA